METKTTNMENSRFIASRFRKNHIAKLVNSIFEIRTKDYDNNPDDLIQRYTLKPGKSIESLIDSIKWCGKIAEVVNEKCPQFSYKKFAYEVNGHKRELKWYPKNNSFSMEGTAHMPYTAEMFDDVLRSRIALSSNYFNDSTAIPVYI